MTAEKNKTLVAKAAGLPATAISNYINRGYLPGADIALKIARALSVPLDWLVDDSQDWPPPPASVPASLTAEQLASELGRRLHGIGIALLAKLAKAQRTQWEWVAAELLKCDADAELPKELADIMTLPGQITYLMGELQNFDPHCPVGADAPREILKDVRPDYEVTLLELQRMFSDLDA